jgi:hypothetical protein
MLANHSYSDPNTNWLSATCYSARLLLKDPDASLLAQLSSA